MKMKHIIPVVLFASASLTVGAQTQLKSGIDLTNLDNSVRPVDNFYQYARCQRHIRASAASTNLARTTTKRLTLS